MPTKFVQNSARKAGVSVETAEAKWHDAKAAVHKGKRRGSWYWGKVVNTFKKMMGLTEAVTLREWLMFESESPFATWPEKFHLYDRYVAVKVIDDELYVSYEVEALMGENTNIQLSGGASKFAANPDEVSYTLGYDRDFTQKLGIRGDNKFSNFKEWAINAVKQFIAREGLAESALKDGLTEAKLISIQQGTKKWPDRIMLKNGYYLEFERQAQVKRVYSVKRLMDDTIYGNFWVAKRVVSGTMWYFWQLAKDYGAPVASLYPKDGQFDAFDHVEAKKWVNENLHKLVTLEEAKKPKQGWYPITLYPIKGRWILPGNGPDLSTFFRKMDAVFGDDVNWDLVNAVKVREKLLHGEEITLRYKEGTINMKELKRLGLQIKFIEGEVHNPETCQNRS